MNPKICLIDVIDKHSSTLDTPLNLVTISSYLISENNIPLENIRILNSAFDNILKEVSDYKPDIIGFSVMTPFYEMSLSLAQKIKTVSNAKLIIGGYHISALPHSLDSVFDFGICGEGEYSWKMLMDNWIVHKLKNKKLLTKIPGIIFKDKGSIYYKKNDVKLDLSKMPKTNWELIEKERIYRHVTVPINGVWESVKVASLYTARGCPYECSFCAHRVIDSHYNHKIRFYDLNHCVEEINYLYKKFGVTCIQILDDTFGVSKDRVKSLISILEKSELLGKISFYNIFIRANLVDIELAGLLKKLNVSTVFIGVESGSQKILSTIKDGPISGPIVKKAILLLENADIYATCSFILFSPQETKSDLEKSVSLAKYISKQKKIYFLAFSVMTPFPGTKLWEKYVQKMDMNNINWGDFVMSDYKNINEVPKIFYNKAYLNKKVAKYYWHIFIDISTKIQDTNKKSISYDYANKTTIHQNRGLYKSWEISKRTKTLNNRINKILANPNLYLNKIATNPGLYIKKIARKPKIILYIISDLCLSLTLIKNKIYKRKE